MITEDYVSYGTAKLLKEKGFKEWCSKCYGLDVRHNGEPIDFDEEYELKDAGRENEIEYVDGGRMYDYGCGNFNPGSPYAAPSLYVAMKWLREEKDVQIEISIVGTDTWESPTKWMYGFRCQTKDVIDRRSADFSSYEQACEAAIRYCLENLI